MKQMLLLIAILAPMICFGQDIENDIIVKSYAVPDSVSKNPANFSVSDSISFAKGYSLDIPLEKSPSNFDLTSPAETIASDKNAVLPGMAVIPLWNNAQFIATGDIQVMP